MSRSNYNPAEEGMAAGRRENAELEAERVAAQATATAASHSLRKLIANLQECEAYLNDGHFLAAIGTFAGLGERFTDLAALIKVLQRFNNGRNTR